MRRLPVLRLRPALSATRRRVKHWATIMRQLIVLRPKPVIVAAQPRVQLWATIMRWKPVLSPKPARSAVQQKAQHWVMITQMLLVMCRRPVRSAVLPLALRLPIYMTTYVMQVAICVVISEILFMIMNGSLMKKTPVAVMVFNTKSVLFATLSVMKAQKFWQQATINLQTTTTRNAMFASKGFSSSSLIPRTVLL